MLFSPNSISAAQAKLIAPRLLAHLGDAVFELYERERQLLSASSVSHLHKMTSGRTSAAAQARLLDAIEGRLNNEEKDLVRRARNQKPQQRHRGDQAAYRKSTAFEALVGFLYLSDSARLKTLMQVTLPKAPKSTAGAENRNLPES